MFPVWFRWWHLLAMEEDYLVDVVPAQRTPIAGPTGFAIDAVSGDQ